MSSSLDRYYEAFLISQEYLLNCNTSFPLDVFNHIKQEKIYIKTISEYREWCLEVGQSPTCCVMDAKCFYYPEQDTYLIIYDETKNRYRVRFSLAHELGHIVMGHLNDKITELARGGVADYIYWKMEGEANTFAGNLLAPPILIHQYKDSGIDATLIKSKFNLSIQASRWRLEDYLLWKQLKPTPIEYDLLKKYWLF